MPIVPPDENSINSLISNSVNISILPELSSSTVIQSDVFTYAIDPLQNYNVDKGTLDNTILESILTDNLSIKGNWQFGQPRNTTVKIETSAILNEYSNNHNKNVVLNLSAFEKLILAKIDALSNEIYKQPKVPTHIGEVIATTATFNKLSDYFPGTWEVLSGDDGKYNLMIAGAGEVLANTIESKYGELSAGEFNAIKSDTLSGASFVKLSKGNITDHSHRFVGKPIQINFEWSYHGDKASNCIATGVLKNSDWGYENKPEYHKAMMGTLGGVIQITGGGSFSTQSVFGDSLSYLSGIYDPSSGVEITSGQSHNNVPPVFFARIFQRKE